MNRRAVSGILAILLVMGALLLVFNIQLVEASGTIYIRPDGSVDPPTAPIQRDGDHYTLVGNISSDGDGIVIERDNILLDGAGYTLLGIGLPDWGILLGGRRNVTVRNMKIGAFWGGVFLHASSETSIVGNHIQHGWQSHTANYYGIALSYSDSNTISGNDITANWFDGIYFYGSNYNIISGNNITANFRCGIRFEAEGHATSHNTIYENNLENNDCGICLSEGSSYNTVNENNLENNNRGIEIFYSSDWNRICENNMEDSSCAITIHKSSHNAFHHNSLLNNDLQVLLSLSPSNSWDNGYPSGGNYWSDQYHGEYADLYHGPNQDRPGGDGIVDAPYVIDENNQDNYPLVKPPVPPGLSADLVRRQAWPEHNHFDVSKDEDGYQTLHAKVENTGNQTMWCRAVFYITRNDGVSTVIESESLFVERDHTVEFSAAFGILTNADTGRYYVSATCEYSHNKIVWGQGEKEKSFKFTVAP